VKVVILLPEEADIGDKEWYQAAAKNQVFDFLQEPEEDIYTLSDGRSFNDQE